MSTMLMDRTGVSDRGQMNMDDMESENFYREIAYFLGQGSYNTLTITSSNPENRKRVIRRASKSYLIKGEKLFYNRKGTHCLVVQDPQQIMEVLKESHDSAGHPGKRRTLDRVMASYFWRTLHKDVAQWVDECPKCQRLKEFQTGKGKNQLPLLPPMVLKEAWSVLGMDLIGPLPTTAKGKQYILTSTDLFTKWVVAKSLHTKTAEEVAKKIASILLDFGLVEQIITDQDCEFTNQVNHCLFAALGIKNCLTSAYHRQTKGQNETTNRMIKTAMAKLCGEQQNNWDVYLRSVVLSINTSKQRSTKYTPYCALFGRNPRSPGVINITQNRKDSISVDIKEKIDVYTEDKAAEVVELHTKICHNIQATQEQRRSHRRTIKDLNAKTKKEVQKEKRLESDWSVPSLIGSISKEGWASPLTAEEAQLISTTSVSQLTPLIEPNETNACEPDSPTPNNFIKVEEESCIPIDDQKYCIVEMT